MNKITAGLSTVAVSAAAAAATAATIAATTAAATAITAAAAGGPLFARTSLVYGQGTALKFFSVKLGNRRIRLGLRSHFNKGKTTRTAGGPVLHDVNCDDRARRGKIILQIIFSGTEGEVPNE